MEASGTNASTSLVEGTNALEFDDETLRGNNKSGKRTKLLSIQRWREATSAHAPLSSAETAHSGNKRPLLGGKMSTPTPVLRVLLFSPQISLVN